MTFSDFFLQGIPLLIDLMVIEIKEVQGSKYKNQNVKWSCQMIKSQQSIELPAGLLIDMVRGSNIITALSHFRTITI